MMGIEDAAQRLREACDAAHLPPDLTDAVILAVGIPCILASMAAHPSWLYPAAP